MSRRIRASLSLVAMSVGIALLSAAPVAAAANPTDAVADLVDRISAGRFIELDDVVCASEQAAVREQFDIAAQFEDLPGIDASEFEDAFTITVSEIAIDLISEDGDEALVRLRGQMASELDSQAAEALVASMAELFGEELDDTDTEPLVASMIASFTQEQALDEQVRVVREGDEWLVCDPIIGGDAGGSVPVEVSTAGLCGLVSLEAVNLTGALTFDSSVGSEESCSYTNRNADVFMSVAATVDRFNSIEQFEQIYADLDVATVAGQPALVSADVLYAGLADGSTLVVTYFVDDPERLGVELDPRAQMIALAELLAPVIPAREPDPTAAPARGLFDDQLPLCDALTLEQLNALGEPQYDVIDGEGEFCSYTLSDVEQGFNFVTLSLAPDSDLEEFTGFLPGGEDLLIGESAAYLYEGQLFIETERGLLTVGAFATDAQGQSSIDGHDYAAAIANAVIARLGDLTAPDEQAGSASTAGDVIGTPERPLCGLVSLDALNAIGPLQYDDVFDGGGDLCVYSATTVEQGPHSLTIFTETFSFAEIQEVLDGGISGEIDGLATYGLDETLWVDVGSAVVAISPLLDDAVVDPGTDTLGVATQVAGILVGALSEDG